MLNCFFFMTLLLRYSFLGSSDSTNVLLTCWGCPDLAIPVLGSIPRDWLESGFGKDDMLACFGVLDLVVSAPTTSTVHTFPELATMRSKDFRNNTIEN